VNSQGAVLKIAVLISGAGRSLQNLIQRIDRGELNADIRLVVSSRASAGGLDIARSHHIPVHIMPRKAFDRPESHRDAIFAAIRDSQVDLVVMAGYLQHLLIPDDFKCRVINIHPSLIPEFCGKGCYGDRVHAAVLDAGVSTTGCTVHFVDNQYDHGPIILSRRVKVLPKDTPQTLAQRVFAEECKALPEAIRLIAQRRLGCHLVPVSDSTDERTTNGDC
jgi:phosphoribosylglycinamide formyltransferase-1